MNAKMQARIEANLEQIKNLDSGLFFLEMFFGSTNKSTAAAVAKALDLGYIKHAEGYKKDCYITV